jgi:hypothetical protein
MWFRYRLETECHSCKRGMFVHANNWIFYECPRCKGASLGCDCERGLVAVPREQIRSGEWVKFSEPDERGCVEVTNLDQKESSVQAISEGYPW